MHARLLLWFVAVPLVWAGLSYMVLRFLRLMARGVELDEHAVSFDRREG